MATRSPSREFQATRAKVPAIIILAYPGSWPRPVTNARAYRPSASLRTSLPIASQVSPLTQSVTSTRTPPCTPKLTNWLLLRQTVLQRSSCVAVFLFRQRTAPIHFPESNQDYSAQVWGNGSDAWGRVPPSQTPRERCLDFEAAPGRAHFPVALSLL
jgi:hypothetical protein